jgi:hypothetical protein
MVSQMELSTTCRHVGRGLIPRPQLIRRRRDLRLAVHRSKECDLFVASANSDRQENRSRPPKQQRTKDRRTGRCRCRGPRQQHRARLCLGRRLGADGRHSTRNHRNCGPAVALPRLSRRVPLRVPSPPQPTFSPLGFNFDTDLGILSRNTPVVTYSTSADISRFVDPGVPVLGTIKYYEEMAEQFGAWIGRSGSRASTRSRTWATAPVDRRPIHSIYSRCSPIGLKTALLPAQRPREGITRHRVAN